MFVWAWLSNMLDSCLLKTKDLLNILNWKPYSMERIHVKCCSNHVFPVDSWKMPAEGNNTARGMILPQLMERSY